MRSDKMKKGIERAPHRSLCKAMGYTDDELARPIIGIANSANEVIPGHMHLNQIASAVKIGIAMFGGTPMEFSTIGVCDGIAMGHDGMKYSLISRELIADSVEIMATAFPFDGLILICNCLVLLASETFRGEPEVSCFGPLIKHWLPPSAGFSVSGRRQVCGRNTSCMLS